MELKKLLEGVEIKRIIGSVSKEIQGIAYHSSQVERGFLFAALRGLETDGHYYIGKAIEKGAEAILLEEGPGISASTLIYVPNSRQALAKVSSNFYGNPSSTLTLIGITGTNGKTTTTYLLEAILKKAGFDVGVLGTINYRFKGKVFPSTNTTPESLDLQRILWEMSREGVSHAIMEVSSHGLILDRVFDCQFDCALFTNFSPEHLDFHKSLSHYFEGKKRLFSTLLVESQKRKKFAVINEDDPKAREIIDGVKVPTLRYGLHPSCEISADQIESTFEGLRFRLKTPKGELFLHSRLIGDFNLYNIMASAAVGIGMEIPLERIQEGIESVEGIPGRFEKVENPKGIHFIVDYAHTHDALERALKGLTNILKNIPEKGKVITVFGCGGDRDRTKRPLMGEVAGRYSDLTIITSDNPRTEDPLAIIQEVEKGLVSLPIERWSLGRLNSWRLKKGYLKIPDRREAIRVAIRLAQPHDTILIAGKGHEDYQIIGKQRFPFDDRIEAQKALDES